VSQPIAASWVDRTEMERGNPQGLYVEAGQDDQVVTPATAVVTLTDPVGGTHSVGGTVDASLRFYLATYAPTITGFWTYTWVTTSPALTSSGGFTVRDSSAN
jgi:hypothetical protein